MQERNKDIKLEPGDLLLVEHLRYPDGYISDEEQVNRMAVFVREVKNPPFRDCIVVNYIDNAGMNISITRDRVVKIISKNPKNT